MPAKRAPRPGSEQDPTGSRQLEGEVLPPVRRRCHAWTRSQAPNSPRPGRAVDSQGQPEAPLSDQGDRPARRPAPLQPPRSRRSRRRAAAPCRSHRRRPARSCPWPRTRLQASRDRSPAGGRGAPGTCARGSRRAGCRSVSEPSRSASHPASRAWPDARFISTQLASWASSTSVPERHGAHASGCDRSDRLKSFSSVPITGPSASSTSCRPRNPNTDVESPSRASPSP
jgi:hypothetical protein